jgi:hypothetical protein
MRRGAIMVAVVTLSCSLATAAPAAATTIVLSLQDTAAHRTEIYPRKNGRWIHGRTFGYWGTFTAIGTPGGSYRATCLWLANTKWPNIAKQDNRLSCTVVISFQDGPLSPLNPHASGFVLQGLVKRPVGKEHLFARPSMRQLVVTGGTGWYAGAYGYAELRLPWTIAIHYGLLPPV